MSKKPLPAEKSEECLRLKALFSQKKRAMGLTQEKLAHRLGMNQSSVSHYLNGVNPLNTSVAAAFAKLLKVSVADFSPRLALQIAEMTSLPAGRQELKSEPSTGAMLTSMDLWDERTPVGDDEVAIPFLREVELAAGSGRFAVEENAEATLRFGKRDLRRNSVRFDQARCVTVRGNSMWPVLRDQATVGIDLGKTTLGDVIDGDLYALDHNGLLRVKQVYRLPSGLRLRSFNRDEHPDEVYSAEQLEKEPIRILGRVFWWGMYAR